VGEPEGSSLHALRGRDRDFVRPCSQNQASRFGLPASADATHGQNSRRL